MACNGPVVCCLLERDRRELEAQGKHIPAARIAFALDNNTRLGTYNSFASVGIGNVTTMCHVERVVAVAARQLVIRVN
jgi:hypothetical protein